MMTGTTLAQAIPIAVTPVLTRLYPPEAFGVFGLYVVAVGVLGVIATGRYELAIVLPEDDADARAVGVLALLLALIVTAVSVGVAVFAARPLAMALGAPEATPWLRLVPLGAFASAVFQVFQYWANRQARYGVLATAAVGQQSGAAVTSVGLGVARAGSGGLVFGHLVGQAVSVSLLGWQGWRGRRRGVPWRWPSRVAIRRVAGEHRRFLLYNMPYSILTTFSSGVLVVLMSVFGLLQIAGFMNLVRRLLFLPVSFLSASLGQVYFREAARAIGTPRLTDLTLRLLRAVGDAMTPGFVVVAVWAGPLFGAVFGSAWTEAGWYAAAFAPVAFGFLFTSWPERLFEIAQRQRDALVLQGLADGAGIGVVVLVLITGHSPLLAVGAYGVVYLVFHAAYLWRAFLVAGLPPAALGPIFGRVGALTGVCLAIALVLRVAVPWLAVQILLVMVGAGTYYVIVARRFLRVVRGAGNGPEDR
jgi:O-antigen/teichoic acid export membrane protein